MIRAGIANEYVPDSHCVAASTIRRTGVDCMAMIEAATDGIAFDKLDTHYGLSSLSVKFGDCPKFETLKTERWLKIR